MPKHLLRALSVAALAGLGVSGTAYAGPNPYMGQIVTVGETFCPRGYAEADGRLLPIAQNTALFSLLGTTYGGDGRTTFALPDLRGRAPIHHGTGAGLPTYIPGERGGANDQQLNALNLPRHRHNVRGSSNLVSTGNPSGNVLGTFPDPTFDVYNTAPPTTAQMNPGVIGSSGNNMPFNVMQPTQVIRFCVALTGTYPPRN